MSPGALRAFVVPSGAVRHHLAAVDTTIGSMSNAITHWLNAELLRDFSVTWLRIDRRRCWLRTGVTEECGAGPSVRNGTRADPAANPTVGRVAEW